MQGSVNLGPGSHILRIQTVVLSVLRSQVNVDRVAVVYHRSVLIDDRRNRVLGVQLHEFRLQVISSNQVDRLDVQIQAQSLGGQLNGTSRRTQLGGVQHDFAHFGAG